VSTRTLDEPIYTVPCRNPNDLAGHVDKGIRSDRRECNFWPSFVGQGLLPYCRDLLVLSACPVNGKMLMPMPKWNMCMSGNSEGGEAQEKMTSEVVWWVGKLNSSNQRSK
jgi:hypothetical protein